MSNNTKKVFAWVLRDHGHNMKLVKSAAGEARAVLETVLPLLDPAVASDARKKLGQLVETGSSELDLWGLYLSMSDVKLAGGGTGSLGVGPCEVIS